MAQFSATVSSSVGISSVWVFPWQGACRRLERQATVGVVRRRCNLPAVLPHSALAQRRRPALQQAGELICQSCVLLADNSQPPTNSTRYAKLCRQNGECIGTRFCDFSSPQGYSSSQLHCQTATGTHVPYGITRCYLPPGRGDIPALVLAELVLSLATPERSCVAWSWNTHTRLTALCSGWVKKLSCRC